MSAPSARFGPYTLVRELGAGGMGEVHLARDSRLGREVAIKLLPDALASDPDRRSRLLREARAAAALNHPNIATIYDVGEAEGRDYVAFERIEGETLSEVLAARSLSIDEVLAIALPLADALAYAHEQGVIHRDVKAGNVMLTARGAPKLLDFGLAKLETGAEVDDSTQLTLTGAIVGTPGAMSPEQAQGRPVDARSDVFSFGSLLYELIARRPAFEGPTVMDVVAAVLRDQPRPLAERRADVPADLTAVVERALRKDPAERYASMRGLLADLERVTDRAAPRSAAPFGRGPSAALVGVVLLVALGWSAWRLLGGGDSGALERTSFAGVRFGVIGFEGVGDEVEHLVRLLVPLVTTDLAESGGLEVLSHARIREAERKVRGGDAPFDPAFAREVARAAGAEVMLVGDVAQRREGLQVLGEIVEVGSGRSLGAARAGAASPDELFEVAAALCAEVRAELGLDTPAGRESLDPADFLTRSTAAWNRFVAGRLALHDGDYGDAVQHFGGALREDETFALAAYYLALSLDWSGAPDSEELAVLERGRPYVDRLPPRWRGTYEAAIAIAENDLDRAYETLNRLVERPDVLPDALNLLGEVLEHDLRYWNPARARELFERALAIDPTFEVVVFHLVGTLLRQGDDAALDELIRSLRAQDPESTRALTSEAMRSIWHRRWGEAAAPVNEIVRRGLTMGWWFAGRLAENEDRLDEAMEHYTEGVERETSFRRSFALQSRALLHLRAGRFAATLADLDAAIAPIESGEYEDVRSLAVTFRIDQARLLDLLGDREGALEAIHRATGFEPQEPRGHYWLVQLLLRHGERDAAARAVERFEAEERRTHNVAFPFWARMIDAERALASGELERARTALGRAHALPPETRDIPAEHWLTARLAEAEGDSRRAADEYGGVVPTYFWYVQWGLQLSIESELRRQCLLQDLRDPDFRREVLEEGLGAWGSTDLPLVEELRQRLSR